jgi:hypothetical protein
VLDPGQLAVKLNYFQQSPLRLGRCFHGATLACPRHRVARARRGRALVR